MLAPGYKNGFAAKLVPAMISTSNGFSIFNLETQLWGFRGSESCADGTLFVHHLKFHKGVSLLCLQVDRCHG